MKNQPPEEDFEIKIPIQVTYRLESDKSTIEQEEGIMPMAANARLMQVAQAQAKAMGRPIEKFLLDFVTKVYAERLAKDEQALKKLKDLAKKHRCNILTEVTLNGQITWPQRKQK